MLCQAKSECQTAVNHSAAMAEECSIEEDDDELKKEEEKKKRRAKDSEMEKRWSS